MDEQTGSEFYISRRSEIVAIFNEHAAAWRLFLVRRYGNEFTAAVLEAAHREHDALIPQIPYIGGDGNSMTRHLIRSTTSLVLYKAMKAMGKTAEETGKIIYDAVVKQVRSPDAPIRHRTMPGTEEIMKRRREGAKKSQERRYPGDWVYEAVEGDGVEFDHGLDIFECGTQKLYHAHDADEFLPFYCFLDFVTSKAADTGLARTMTLAEGYEKCNFRYKRGRKAYPEWPPPFLDKE